MSNLTKREVVEYTSVVIVLIASIITLFLMPIQEEHTYDCSIAEISPDYPVQVKEECRKLRAENILQKPK